jgi:hypothetical protein
MKIGYFQQQSCTGDPVLRLSHQKDKKEQDHIVGWQISMSGLLQFSDPLITASLIVFPLAL